MRLQRIVLHNLHINQIQFSQFINTMVEEEIKHSCLEINIEIEQEQRFITIWTLLQKIFEHLPSLKWSYFIYGENNRSFDAQLQQHSKRFNINDLDTIIELKSSESLVFTCFRLQYKYNCFK
jgi:hypothetical protein